MLESFISYKRRFESFMRDDDEPLINQDPDRSEINVPTHNSVKSLRKTEHDLHLSVGPVHDCPEC